MFKCNLNFLKLCYLCVLLNNVVAENCYTPEKNQGRCVPLTSCPEMMDVFANPRRSNENYLRKFICESEEEHLKVCCSSSQNYTEFIQRNSVPVSDDDFDSQIKHDKCETRQDGENFALPVLMEIQARDVQSSKQFTKCIGSLINARYVLTSASCLKQDSERVLIESIKASVNDNGTNSSQFFSIENQLTHPFYDESTGFNNLGLLRLNETVVKGYNLMCIRLAYVDGPRFTTFSLSHNFFNIDNKEEYNLKEDVQDRKKEKQEEYEYEYKDDDDDGTTDVTLTSIDNCNRILKEKGINVTLTKYDLCVKNDSTVTIFNCSRAGMPLFSHWQYLDKSHDLFLKGLSSSMKSCATYNLIYVYTDISAYLDWITENMQPFSLTNEKCVMPNGNTGYQYDVLQCPILKQTLTNSKKDNETYLRRFILSEDYAADMVVCCNISSSTATVNGEKYLSKKAENITNIPAQFLGLETCGYQHRDDYVLPTDDITIDEFPWLAIIGRRDSPWVAGTGTLINSRYVLSISLILRFPANYIVRLGEFDQRNNTDCVQEPGIEAEDCSDYEEYDVEEVILHPLYLLSYKLGNIALLRLNQTISFTGDYIRPICLPIFGTKTATTKDIVLMSSWDIDKQRRLDNVDIKKKVFTTLLTAADCEKEVKKLFYYEYTHSYVMCAKHTKNNTRFARIYDSGGPLMFHTNYKWHIEGMFFDSLPTNSQNGILLFVKVQKYLNWIIENMKPWEEY